MLHCASARTLVLSKQGFSTPWHSVGYSRHTDAAYCIVRPLERSSCPDRGSHNPWRIDAGCCIVRQLGRSFCSDRGIFNSWRTDARCGIVRPLGRSSCPDRGFHNPWCPSVITQPPPSRFHVSRAPQEHKIVICIGKSCKIRPHAYVLSLGTTDGPSTSAVGSPLPLSIATSTRHEGDELLW